MSAARTPIGDHGLIGDTRTAALVGPDGSIDWCCVPRFDAPPLLGRLVAGDGGGHFALGPTEPAACVGRAYLDSTTTLETTWAVDGGRLSAADSMVAEVAGRLLPETLLVRRLTAAGRPVPVAMRLAPRFGEERRPPPRCRRLRGGVVFEDGGLAAVLAADGDATPAVDEDVRFTVEPGRPVTVVLSATRHGPAVLVPPAVAAREAARDERGWRAWADAVDFDSPYRDAVVRSLLTLQLLTYSPSGAPVAAPTTSLPEQLGGSRNWDYRHAWPRDASIGIAAFLSVGKVEEARSFLAWLRHAGRLSRPRLPPLFGLDGRPGPDERELATWPGYAGSRPVRIGNGASTQHQLDGYGWVVDAAWLLTDAGERLDGETWRVVRGLADEVARAWRAPDAGMWERRGTPRHHVHSKVMAWLALDRAARIAERRGGRATARARSWRAARDEVGADLHRHGYDDALGAYTAAYGTRSLDAALLVLPLVGLEPPGSPRVEGTIDAIRTTLGAGGPLLYRYLEDDGVAGQEGAFLPVSFWLVQALVHLGRTDEAATLFEELLELGGPLGLYAEEMDPTTRQHLGNFPQALTHAALLQAALALEGAARP